MAPAPELVEKNGMSYAKALKWAGAILATAWLLSMCTNSGERAPANATQNSGAMRESAALALCQSTFRQLAKDPENAKVPAVPNLGQAGEFYFAWGGQTSMMRMRNGLGIEVAVSGSCVVDTASRRIKLLTMDGKTLITE